MKLNKVYYITSKEPYLVKEKLNSFKNEFIKKYTEFNYKEITPEKLEMEIEVLPFMSEKKMIMVEIQKNNTANIEDLIPNIPDYCCVVIIGILDKRKKLYKRIKKYGEIIEIKQYNTTKMVNWIMQKAKEQQIKISKKCSEQIIEYCGINDMYMIESEIIKLASMNEPITINLINKVTTKNIEYNAFLLVEKIITQNKKEAFEIINNIEDKSELFKLLALLNQNFAVIRLIQEMSYNDIKNAEIHPYQIKKLSHFKDKYSVSEIDRILTLCQKTDYDMKNGMDAKLAIEKLIGVI